MSSIRSILEELNEYDTKKHPEFIDQALKEISELIDEAKPSYIFDDGNNDATWAYKKGVTEYQSNLESLLK